MWTADSVAYRLETGYTKAYQGETLIWLKNLPVPQNDEIIYVSSDGQSITPFANPAGLTIVSNINYGAYYVLKYDGTITELPTDMYYAKTTLAKIYLPSSIQNVGAGLFRECSSLTSCHFYSNNVLCPSCPDMPSFFENCTSLTSISNCTYGDNKSILRGGGMYKGCTGITSLIGNALKYEFCNAGLKTITIDFPDSGGITIPEWAFAYCPLESIYIRVGRPDLSYVDSYAFYGIKPNGTITGPALSRPLLTDSRQYRPGYYGWHD